MRQIVRIKFGSHLYGTDTPKSDLDYKAVFIPSARDILLQRVKGSVSTKREKAEGEKNLAGEVDEESYSVQRYLGLLAEGQTVALDVLFSPLSSMVGEPSSEWREIMANRARLLTRKSAAFVGYCRQQANKYGIKGSRVAAARKALALLTDELAARGSVAKLGDIGGPVKVMTDETEHMELLDITNSGGITVTHWEVCGRKMPYTASIKFACGVMDGMVREYGHRALQAEKQEGVDWKALSHAVRVGNQAIELLTTGHVTFPLPNADHVRAIKLGERDYKSVGEEIEHLLVEVEAAAERSELPDQPDYEWIDSFIANVHRDTVLFS